MCVMENTRRESLKISELRENLENISVIGRVLSVSQPRTIQTKRGLRTISEAYIGDETGRVKLTLWGNLAGSVKEGSVIEVSGAWTTSYRGEVQLNAGSRSSVRVREDLQGFPERDAIPENTPRASTRVPRGREFGRHPRRGGPRERFSGESEET